MTLIFSFHFDGTLIANKVIHRPERVEELVKVKQEMDQAKRKYERKLLQLNSLSPMKAEQSALVTVFGNGVNIKTEIIINP